MTRTTMVRASRTFVRHVMTPRLRPSWRVAIKAVLALMACTFAWWATRALATVVADHEWKEIQVMVDRQRTEMEAARDRERYEAWRKASSNGYAPGDEQLCELLYHRDVAVCDREALKRLAAEAARGTASNASASSRRTGHKPAPSSRPFRDGR